MPIAQCYATETGGTSSNAIDETWVPCGQEEANSGSIVPCCRLGSLCMTDNFCLHADTSSFENSPSGSPYYVSACTSPDLSDPACSLNCAQSMFLNVVYQGSGQWACCSNATSDDIDCENPTGGIFRAPPPEKLIATVSLGGINSAYEQDALSSALPSSLEALWYSNAPSFTAVINSEFGPSETPAWATALPSRVNSYLKAADHTAPITYTDVVLGTAGASQPTVQPEPNRQASSGSDSGDDDLGVKVGVPVAIVVALVIAAIVGFIFWKKRRSSKESRLNSNPPPMSQPPPQDMYTQYQTPYAPVPQSSTDHGAYSQSASMGGTSYPPSQYHAKYAQESMPTSPVMLSDERSEVKELAGADMALRSGQNTLRPGMGSVSENPTSPASELSGDTPATTRGIDAGGLRQTSIDKSNEAGSTQVHEMP